jgi:predicted metal-dependent hydrolase
MEIEVVRSARRRKTSSASVVDGKVRVLIPAWMSAAQEREVVDHLVARVERQHASKEVDLAARAALLSARHDLPAARAIRWVSNQGSRWGSCTPSTGEIRVSDRMAAFPLWVIDAVVVHELAHLVEPGHGPAFRALEERYPKLERATGFLIAKGFDEGAGDLSD